MLAVVRFICQGLCQTAATAQPLLQTVAKQHLLSTAMLLQKLQRIQQRQAAAQDNRQLPVEADLLRQAHASSKLNFHHLHMADYRLFVNFLSNFICHICEICVT